MMCLYTGHIGIKITVLHIRFIVQWMPEIFVACMLAQFF